MRDTRAPRPSWSALGNGASSLRRLWRRQGAAGYLGAWLVCSVAVSVAVVSGCGTRSHGASALGSGDDGAPDDGSPGEFVRFHIAISTPHPYDNGYSAEWLVEPPIASRRMMLYFSRFSVEDAFDNLYVYDGETGGILETLTGDPGALTTGPYEARWLRLVFVADTTVTGFGFDLEDAGYVQ